MAKNETRVEMHLATFRKSVEEKIAAYNAALKTNDKSKIDHAEEELKAAEKAYADQAALVAYEKIMKSKNPMVAAATMHSFFVIGHKSVKSNGILTGFELVEDKERQIDLLKFCTKQGLPTKWASDVDALNQLLAVKDAYELGISDAEKQRIVSDFLQSDVVRSAIKDAEAGKTPFSNTALCNIINGILKDTVGGTYKCNSHDLKYIDKLTGKKSRKQKLTVEVGNYAFFRLVICDVIHRVVTGGVYSLDHSRLVKKNNATTATAEAPASATTSAEVVEEKAATPKKSAAKKTAKAAEVAA